MFDKKFYQQLALVILTVLLGGVALWTWQLAYWRYQLHLQTAVQTEDWKHRERYSRKDSQRAAMEQLLVEMNQALEDFVTAAMLADSSIQRRQDYKQRGGSDEGLKKWNEEVDQSVEQFNDSERVWLVKSQVILGKLNLLFHDQGGDHSKRWQEISDKSLKTCDLLNAQDSRRLWDYLLELRKRKDTLLDQLQNQIDRFVSKEL